MAHAARGAQRARQDVAVVIHAFVGVAELHAPAVPVAEVFLDFAVVVGHIDHDLAHAVARQVLDQVLHHRLAQYGHHGLGQVFGERAHARALPGGEDHPFGHIVVSCCGRRVGTAPLLGLKI